MDEDREDLRFGRRLAADAEDWDETKDPGALLRGARLLKAKEWLADHPQAPATVRAFVDASDAEEEDAQAAKLAQERQLREAAEAARKGGTRGSLTSESSGSVNRDVRIEDSGVLHLSECCRRWAPRGGRLGLVPDDISRTEADRARRTLAANHFREATIRLDAGELNRALPYYAAALRLDPTTLRFEPPLSTHC